MTPILVKLVNANDNFATDNVIYANVGSQKAVVDFGDFALAA